MKRVDFLTIDSTNEEAKRRIRAVDSPITYAVRFASQIKDLGQKGKSANDRYAEPTNDSDHLFGTVISARAQTAGKGRRGRDFHSPGTGDSVYLSFILRPPAQPEALQLLTIAAAVAVCRTIEPAADIDPEPASGATGDARLGTTGGAQSGTTGGAQSGTTADAGFGMTTQRPAIKWVNDILVDGKKVCGILAEGVPAMGSDRAELAAVVLGIGVNITVQTDDFPPELRETVGSLWLPSGGREGFVQLLCKNIFEGVSELAEDAAGIMGAYRRYENTTGKRILVSKFVDPGPMPGAIPAYAKAIADDGGLVVVYADGREETLRSGEVSVLPQDRP